MGVESGTRAWPVTAVCIKNLPPSSLLKGLRQSRHEQRVAAYSSLVPSSTPYGFCAGAPRVLPGCSHIKAETRRREDMGAFTYPSENLRVFQTDCGALELH
jgi:hypothetical protein